MPQARILLKAVTAGDELRVSPKELSAAVQQAQANHLTEKPQADGEHLFYAGDHPFVLDEDN